MVFQAWAASRNRFAPRFRKTAQKRPRNRESCKPCRREPEKRGFRRPYGKLWRWRRLDCGYGFGQSPVSLQNRSKSKPRKRLYRTV